MALAQGPYRYWQESMVRTCKGGWWSTTFIFCIWGFSTGPEHDQKRMNVSKSFFIYLYSGDDEVCLSYRNGNKFLYLVVGGSDFGENSIQNSIRIFVKGGVMDTKKCRVFLYMIQKYVRIFVLKCVRSIQSCKCLFQPVFPYFNVYTSVQVVSPNSFLNLESKLCANFLIYTNMERDEFESAKRGQKKTRRLSVSIRKEVYDALKVYVDANGYDTSKLVEKVIEKFLQTRG